MIVLQKPAPGNQAHSHQIDRPGSLRYNPCIENTIIHGRSQSMTEQQKPRPSKILRGVAVTLMAIAVVVTLLAGAGTTCVAFAAEKFGSMAALVPYKPLYIAFVVVGLAVGAWGIPVTISLVRGGEKAYRHALLVLLIGGVSAGIQMGVSQAVRGASAPVNMRFYLTLLVLVFFLLLRLPPLWQRTGFSWPMGGGSAGASAGTAMVVCGIITLTTPLWAGPTHLSPTGENWVNVLHLPLMAGGETLLLAGAAVFLASLGLVRMRVKQPGLFGRRA
jgi:hypothetical protein